MAIYVWDYESRLARIRELTDEANRLTALVRATNENTRAHLARGKFTVLPALPSHDARESR